MIDVNRLVLHVDDKHDFSCLILSWNLGKKFIVMMRTTLIIGTVQCKFDLYVPHAQIFIKLAPHKCRIRSPRQNLISNIYTFDVWEYSVLIVNKEFKWFIVNFNALSL